MVAEALECLGGNGYVEEGADAGDPARRRRQRDLGGLGQRHGARRPARDGARARGPAGLPGRVRAGARRRRAARRAPRRAAGRRSPGLADDAAVAGARASSRTSRWPSRRPCWCATRRRRSPTRSAPAGWARPAAARSARCRAAWTARRSSAACCRDSASPLIPDPSRSRWRAARRVCGRWRRGSPCLDADVAARPLVGCVVPVHQVRPEVLEPVFLVFGAAGAGAAVLVPLAAAAPARWHRSRRAGGR